MRGFALVALRVMRRPRHGLITRSILLLLAAAMPLCCCVVRSVASPTTDDTPAMMSCCGSTASCQQSDTDSAPKESKTCGGTCCIKAPVTVNDWTPPIDVLGMPIELASWTPMLVDETASINCAHPNRPPPGPWSASAPPLHHFIILQV